MMMTALALLSLAIWLYLLFARGGFWMFRERDSAAPGTLQSGMLPCVAVIVPARDEADVIARSISGLLSQDYPGPFRVILVDDQSTDGTARVAQEKARQLGTEGRLEILSGAERPKGWTGKLWAMQQGVARASASDQPDYFLFTDADIEHTPGNLSRLVARAQAQDLVLTSLMVKLKCKTFAEQLLIPAFVYFFSMLFPFSWANNPGRRVAAAAGGCMLAERRALEAVGGIAAIRDEIIDDCALARAMKNQGPIWLGLATDTHSLRPYADIGEIGKMVSRSAYAQLGYSPLALVGTVLGMLLVYILPAAVALWGSGIAELVGALAWLVMAVTFLPIQRFYGLSALRSLLLPIIGVLYTIFTIVSAFQFWSGRGGMWKGRAQAMASS